MAKEKEEERKVNGEGYYSVTHFIKDMPCILDWDYPKYSHPLWVFWTRPHHQHQSRRIPPSFFDLLSNGSSISTGITEKIKHALLRHSHAAVGGESNTLVQFWAPATIGGRLVLRTSNQPFSINRIDRGLCEYRKHCLVYEIHVENEEEKEEEGVIRRVFRREYPEINPDVEYYSTDEYPQRDFALKCGVRRCLALPVFEASGQGCVGVLEVVDTATQHSSFTSNLFGIAYSILQAGSFKSFSRFDFQDYVLEFFLPPCDTASEDPQNFLDSLLATIKKLFGGLKISSGEELGDELYVEVIKSFSDDEPDSFKICETTRPPLVPEALENEREGQLNVSDEQLSLKTVSSAEQNIVVVTSSEIESRVEISEMEYRTTNISLTREDLKQHFGKKLEDAAKILGVSRSTMKRVCRERGIKKWPFPKRKKFNPSLPPHKHANEFVEGRKERNLKCGRKEPSSSDMPPEQPTAAVLSNKTSAMPMQVVRTMMVKATYGDDIVKFQLPFSSKMTELVEKVTMRFPVVMDTPLSIKYVDDDGDWVLIACDEDLQECMGSLRLLGNTAIKMLVQPTNHAPRI
ncbi:hypothetical protein LguiA_034415 [Lonicera macranthoides]